MTKVYFMRHGKTVFNLENRFQGGLVDSPLLPEGRSGAIKAGLYLRDIDFKAALVSPQGRAYETARLVIAENQHQPIPLIEVNDLRELEFGDWDGQIFLDYQGEPEYEHLKNDPDHYNPSAFHGETYSHFVKRVTETILAEVASYPDANILVVSHSIVTVAAIQILMGTPLADLRSQGMVDNNSVSILELTDAQDAQLLAWNDTSFLK